MSIEVNQVTYTYMPGTAFERTALSKITLTIEEGVLTAIAGHTGSGKSTLVQHLNGILCPTQGSVLVDGQDLSAKDKTSITARRRVGMVFQYPEHQLFEETVEEDIAFGPKNLGLSAEEIARRVRRAMELVRLDYDTYRERSPFQLSGGQKRRAAIAGVLAMEPKYLVLDEPTAGLDPRGRDDLLQRIVRLHREKKMTVIFVSHNMDDIARLADRVIFMHEGRVLLDAPPREAFQEKSALGTAGLEEPETVTLLEKLQQRGLAVNTDAFTAEETAQRIIRALRKRGGGQC
ncbi:MAG: energy-coupling factor transporter ATPase [Negativicutes bacterium]